MKVKNVFASFFLVLSVFCFFSCSPVDTETDIGFSLTKKDLLACFSERNEVSALENAEQIEIKVILLDKTGKNLFEKTDFFSLEEESYALKFDTIPLGLTLRALVIISLDDNELLSLESDDYFTVTKNTEKVIPFSKADLRPQFFTVIFESNGGSAVENQTIEKNKTLTEPKTPTKEGYIFAGWYIDEDCSELFSFETEIAENITLYAKWQMPSVDIQFNPEPGEVVYGTEVTIFSSIEYAAFSGTINGETITSASNEYINFPYSFEITESPTEIAIIATHSGYSEETSEVTYTLKSCEISFETNEGSEINSLSWFVNKPLDLSKYVPKKEGYIFDGWYLGENYETSVGESFIPQEDITLYAKWREENQVASVKFSHSGGNVDYDTTVILSCDTENATIYYNFENKPYTNDSWQYDGWVQYSDAVDGIQLFSASSEINEKTLYAIAVCEGMENSNITSVTYSLAEYTVRFTTNCDTEFNSIETESGKEIILKEYSQLSKEGYDFAGWYLDEECTHSVDESGILIPSKKLANGNNEISLYAKWTPFEYAITYELNASNDNVENLNPESYTIETETITLQNPTRNGYDFVGWYTDEDYTSQITQIEKGSTGDITLYAKWEKVTGSITVTFPSYSDPEQLISYDNNQFTATPGYDSYAWYIDGALQENQTSNSFDLDTDNMTGGIYTIMLVVTGSDGNMYSAEYQLELTK